jgi:hypothetical protein
VLEISAKIAGTHAVDHKGNGGTARGCSEVSALRVEVDEAHGRRAEALPQMQESVLAHEAREVADWAPKEELTTEFGAAAGRHWAGAARSAALLYLALGGIVEAGEDGAARAGTAQPMQAGAPRVSQSGILRMLHSPQHQIAPVLQAVHFPQQTGNQVFDRGRAYLERNRDFLIAPPPADLEQDLPFATGEPNRFRTAMRYQK